MIHSKPDRNKRLAENQDGSWKEIREFYKTQANRRLKRISISVGCVAIVTILVMIFLFDDIPLRVMLFLRGCVGLCAIVYVVLVGVLVYRVNKAYINQRKVPKNRDND